eukprot:1584901-Lingulodinium_polyedra.AAC.1
MLLEHQDVPPAPSLMEQGLCLHEALCLRAPGGDVAHEDRGGLLLVLTRTAHQGAAWPGQWPHRQPHPGLPSAGRGLPPCPGQPGPWPPPACPPRCQP